MADKKLLNSISSGNLDGIDEDVKAHLSSILTVKCKPKNGDLKERGLFAVKFLHAAVAALGKDGTSPHLVSAAHTCCLAYAVAKEHIKLQDELTVPKLIYHIINKIVQEDMLEYLYQLSQFLFDCLHDVTVATCPAIKPIVLNSYGKLWNGCVKHESLCNNRKSLLTTTQLRFLAIKFLFKKEKIEDSDVDKIELAIGRYIQLANKMKMEKSVMKEDLGKVLNTYVGMAYHVLSFDQEKFLFLIVKSVVRTVKYLSQYKLLEEMQCLLDTVQDLSGHNSVKTASLVSSLINSVISMFTVMKMFDKILQENTKCEGSFEEVTHHLNLSNEHLMTIMDADQECKGQKLAIILETCQLILIQLKSVPLVNQLTSSFVDAARMTMTLYLHFLESEWRQIGEAGAPSSGLKRDQIEKNMLDAFHVKFQMFYRLSQILTDDDKINEMMTECLDAVELYLNVLGVVESDKTRFDDKYYFGYLMVKFGHFCFNRNMDELAASFYRNTCQQLTEWCFCDNDKKSARIEESSLGKIYKCLTECYRRQQLWQEALETIATYLHISTDHVTPLVQLWVRVKRDAARDGHQSFTEKTLKNIFSTEEQTNDGDMIITLLQAELEALKEFKRRWQEGEVIVLQDLVAMTADRDMKALYLMSLVPILWMTGFDGMRSVKECVSDVFDLTTKDNPLSCIVRAQAHLWHFILGQEDLCKLYVQPMSDGDPEPLEEDIGNQKPVKEEPLMMCKVYTLHQSETDMGDLEEMLQLLTQSLNGGDVPCQIDLTSLISNLTLAASIFRLYRKPVQELQILCLSLQLCPLSDTQTSTKIRQGISRVLVECGQYHIAELSLPTAEDSGLSEEDLYQRTLLQLQRDRIHLTHQVECGLSRTLSVVDDLVKANSKSWMATLTEGIAKRLLSMYLIQPVKPQTRDTEYALSLAQEAVKLHTAVVHFLLGKDLIDSSKNKDPHVWDRWVVVTELLESILHLGHLYRHVGDIKDARCYLKEGLKITKSLCLPHWTVEFLLELGRINSLSCNEKESIRLLAETALVLRSSPGGDSNNLGSAVKQRSLEAAKSSNNKKIRSGRGKISAKNCKVVEIDPADDCFGFESVREAEIKRPSESDVVSMLSVLNISDDFDLPEPSPHESECSCSLCQDIVVQGLEMLYSETLGELYQYTGSLEKGWQELKKIESSRSCLDKLTAKITTILHENLKSAGIISAKGKKSKFGQLGVIALPSIKQLSIESYSLLAQTALKKCEPDTAEFLSQSALEMLNMESNKDLLQQSFLKAQLQLLQIQAKLQAGGDVFTSEKPGPAKPAATRGRGRASTRKKAATRKNKTVAQDIDSAKCGNPADSVVKETLSDAFGNISHFPSSDVYGCLCRMLACQHLDGDHIKTAYYLGEAMSITFRHQALANTSRKIRKLEKELASSSEESKDTAMVDDLKDLHHVRSLLTFNKDVSHFKQMLTHIPPDWTVCQVTMVKGPDECPKLLLTRLTGRHDPITIHLPGLESVQGKGILTEFKSIMKTSSESMKLKDKNVWWQTRRDLNDRLQSVIDLMEKFWLGKWKCVLQGQISSSLAVTLSESLPQLQREIKKTCKLTLQESVLELVVSLCLSLPVDDHKDVVVKLLSLDVESEVLDPLTSSVTNFCTDLTTDSDEMLTRHPVLLVLDKDIQHLPWESLPCLRHHPVTRIPSLYHLYTQLSVSRQAESHACVRGVNLNDAFYILNPDNDLMSTQESFENVFSSQLGWTGLTGKKPAPDQFKAALTQHDLFIYCGHGSGGKYFSGSDLQQLPCRAVAVLMGCSSGYLQTRGILEATGMINNYFLAGCPTMIANLWDVTDRDIDRFLEGMLRSWMSSDGEGSLLDPIPAARDQCRLPYLIGAAPVVYGFPVSFTRG